MPRKQILLPLLILVLGLAAGPVFAGGWAVATLDDWPDAVIAGEPVEIGFVVRQHGVTVLEGLKPVIVAVHQASGETLDAEAVEDEPGHYRATVTFPDAGDWDWTITAFGPNQPLPALTALPADALHEATPEASDEPESLLVELGATLFVAKGCAVCHRHSVLGYDDYGTINHGPELTSYTAGADFLAAWLADPARVDPGAAMPDLDLDDGEIEALIAFLNAEDDLQTRR